MCSLCGMLGGRQHWTDSSSHAEVFSRRREKHTWQRERQQRTRIVKPILRHYGLTLADWSATAYVLRSHTGKTAMVENLTELWSAAEGLSNKPCDPLDESLLDALAREAGS